MIKAKYEDKGLVTDILAKSFDGNKSVNHIIKQDFRRTERIKSRHAAAGFTINGQ